MSLLLWLPMPQPDQGQSEPPWKSYVADGTPPPIGALALHKPEVNQLLVYVNSSPGLACSNT